MHGNENRLVIQWYGKRMVGWEPDGGPAARRRVRLTDQRLVVMRAVSRQPGLSNRGVSDATGLHDQGHMSRLLKRLSELGVVENTGGGRRLGMANSWQLTLAGRQLLAVWESLDRREGVTDALRPSR